MPEHYRPPTARALRWVEQAAGGRVVRCVRLRGGLTSHVDRITIHCGSADLVLRRWPQAEASGSDLVRREAAGLLALARAQVPTPELVAADPTGELAGTPGLLMSALPGEPRLRPRDLNAYVRHLAGMLARIHDIRAPYLAHSDPHGYQPNADRAWIGNPALTRILHEAADKAADDEPPVVIHGDFQPLNILWNESGISGVVDWTYAGIGTRATDVGHCRLALAVLFSATAAEEFLSCYESELGRPVNSAQDIRALLAFNAGWHEIVERAVDGRAPVEHAGMADRVVAVLTAAARRLA
jgi:aminoglycoside phosphotransferase (APT) family kinase protein